MPEKKLVLRTAKVREFVGNLRRLQVRFPFFPQVGDRSILRNDRQVNGRVYPRGTLVQIISGSCIAPTRARAVLSESVMRIRTPRRFRSSILSPPHTLWKSGATTHGRGVDSYLREAQRGNCVQRMIAHRIRTNQVDRRVATWAANLGSKLALPFSESIIPMQIAAEEAVGEYGEKLLRSLVQVFDLQSAVKTLLPKGKFDYRNYMIAHAYKRVRARSPHGQALP